MALPTLRHATTDADILNLLQSLQEDFFTSLRHGASSLPIFVEAWNAFNKQIHHCRDILQTDTLAVVYSFSTTVGTVTSSLLELQSTSDAIYDNFATDVAKILDEGMTNLAINDGMNDAYSYPLYIESSYKWLLANLGNPYPSKEIRSAISLQTNTPGKDIDAWFTDARKRIGWNALRKSRFSNKRTLVVDAATRFFVNNDPKRPLCSGIELEFAAIEARAKDLYDEKFVESSLATKLDSVVKDLTPQTKAYAKTEEKKRRQIERRKQEKRARDALSYPSPERSPASSPPPLPEQPSDGIIHERPSSRKRRNSSSEECEESFTGRLFKRTRVELSTPLHDFGACSLPSPAASLHEVSNEPCASPPPSVPMSPSVLPSIKRKRRLSDSDGQQAPKRPNNMQIAPRVQAASDPFPMSHADRSFDEWYLSTFVSGHHLDSGIPSPVSVDAPDITVPLDIEVYNFPSSHCMAASNAELSPLDPVTSPSTEYVYNDDNTFSWFDLNNCTLTGLAADPLTSITELMPAFSLPVPAESPRPIARTTPFLLSPDWRNPPSFPHRDPLSPPDTLFPSQTQTLDLLGTFNLDVATTSPELTLFRASPQSQKEEKQKELLAIQRKLTALQAELAATP